MDQLITSQDVEELEEIEQRIAHDMLNAFANVGFGLKQIRNRKLFVIRYPDFGEYTEKRWELTEARANQLIQASDVYYQLTKSSFVNQETTKSDFVVQETTIVVEQTTNNDFVVLPTRESHVRPLLKLDNPEERIEVWRRVVENTNGNGITAKIVEAEVERYKAELSRDWITTEEWEKMTGEEKKNIIRPRLSDSKFNETNDNIEWAAWSWNPVTGCLHGCDYCYARDIAARFYPQKFEPSFYPGRLNAPQNTKPMNPRWKDDIGYRGVFVCSMADLFGKWVPKEWINAVLEQVRKNPQWTFLFLTKFPIRMAEFTYPNNVWLGTTVDRQWAVERAEKAFHKIKESGFTGICWLSCEPMMECLTFSAMNMFDWVVMGGASSSTQTPEYRPPFDDIVHLHNQARLSGCKIYHKTNLYDRLKEYPTDIKDG